MAHRFVDDALASMVFKQKMRELMHGRELSVDKMLNFANDTSDNGFRAMLARRHKDCDTNIHEKVPAKVNIARSTALRWMKLCDAVHGRHVKGYADRRNDADIVQELKDYCVTMDLLQKRMELWMESPSQKHEDKIVIADRLRCDIQDIESGQRFNFNTFYELKGRSPPSECKHGHEAGKCKCHLPLMHWGHDEAVFWSNSLSSLEWTIDGERALRPKNPGRGVMVSTFVCEKRGFGIHITNDEWLQVEAIYKQFSEKHKWFKVEEPLTPEHDRQIGLILFDYGNNKPKEDLSEDDALRTGWWNCAKFTVQCDFIKQCFEILHGETHQLMLQIDQSSGHMSRGPGALNAYNINLFDGGRSHGERKKGIRDTKVFEEDFGPFQTESLRCEGMVDRENPVQYGHYPAIGDNSDRYDVVGPHFACKQSKVLKMNLVINESWKPGKPVSVRHKNMDFGIFHPPPGTKVGDTLAYYPNDKGSEWWRGMRKGHLQLLFETGWIDPADEHPRKSWARDWGKHKPSQKELEEMTNKDGKRISTLHLQSRRDFREEKTIIEKLFIESGHIAIASPRYHPEVAGNGIEYSWGKGKWCFRRYVNINTQSKDLNTNVLKALGSRPFKTANGEVCEAPLPVARVRKFARRARTYRLLFKHLPTIEDGEKARQAWKTDGQKLFIEASGKTITIGPAGKSTSFYAMIDKMYTALKTHGNAIDMDFKFCTETSQ